MERKNLHKVIRQLQGKSELRYCNAGHYRNGKRPNNTTKHFCLRMYEPYDMTEFKVCPDYSVLDNMAHVNRNDIVIYKTAASARNIIVDFIEHHEEEITFRDHKKACTFNYQLSLGPICLNDSLILKSLERYKDLIISKLQVLSLLKITEEPITRSEPITIFGKTVYINHDIPDKSWYIFTSKGMTKEKSCKMVNIPHSPMFLKKENCISTSIGSLRSMVVRYDT